MNSENKKDLNLTIHGSEAYSAAKSDRMTRIGVHEAFGKVDNLIEN